MWFDGIGMRWCINAHLSNGVAVVKVAKPTSDDPSDSGAVLCLPTENPALIDTFREYLLFLLTILAIEHRYIPWLRLAATLPYTGAKAAQAVMQAWGEPLLEMPVDQAFAEIKESCSDAFVGYDYSITKREGESA
ncbi:MAG: hypothetical protein AAF959_08225 [Cyanobacteria bacterium P01_D01_bin.56]